MTTYDLGAAASASAAFDAAGRRAYVACLDSSVHCLNVRQPGEAAGKLALALAWRRTLSGPVFSDPVVRPDGALLVAAVDGTVSALSSAGAAGLILASIAVAALPYRLHPHSSCRLCSMDPPMPLYPDRKTDQIQCRSSCFSLFS